jgi:hypothetical protein
MAARTYLSSSTTEDEQKKVALSLIEKMVRANGKDRFSGISKSSGEGDVPGAFVGAAPGVKFGASTSRETTWQQGASYKFQLKMYMLPMIPGAKRGKGNLVDFESESWLGRDPSEEECIKGLQRRKSISSVSGGDFLFDNGC